MGVARPLSLAERAGEGNTPGPRWMHGPLHVERSACFFHPPRAFTPGNSLAERGWPSPLHRPGLMQGRYDLSRMNALLWVGTSGWIYPHWAGRFYPSGLPQAQWFAHYARTFRTVEINYSFYRLPSEGSFDRWREQAPPGFRYAVKANRYLTHLKRLRETGESLERFLSRARRLEHASGPILWQLPPHWRANPQRLADFAAAPPHDMVHAFEFRDPSWFNEAVRKILSENGLSFCIYHMPGLECPLWVTGPVIYLRFHGSGEVYGGRYGPQGLRHWARQIKRWLEAGHTVYAYFNNDAFGYAVEDARTLLELLDAPAGRGPASHQLE